MTQVHVVVPEGIDDPRRPSGGNTYDRELCRGLAKAGWAVHEHAVQEPALARVVRQIPAGAVVLIDALVASTAPAVLVPQAQRLRLVVLVHMPIGDERERAVLHAASATVTTSEWGRRRLRQLYGLPAEKVHVATPGVEPAPLASATADGGALLCVAAVTPLKGHDVLAAALASVADLPWSCDCVGSLDRDAAFATAVRQRAPDRMSFDGPRTGADLARSYAGSDLLVLASRTETYGMVVTEALARGVPVVASDVGGIREAVGDDAGLLVPPDDPVALAAALRAWLTDPALRSRLRRSARDRRATLSGWPQTTSAVAAVLTQAAA